MSGQNADTLLFIADISGFTRFLNETEVDHSTHIIRELLEIIVDNDDLGMKVAEIEGDAVFFYLKAPIPPIRKILAQSRKMFIAFHEHLKIYERDRICQCGACVSASNLSLKFVSQVGEVIFQEIAGRTQLMGKEVTLVHKLLKNDIEEDEYLLFCESMDISTLTEEDCKIQLREGAYDGIGQVKYAYCSLSDLLQSIPVPPPYKTRKFRNERPMRKRIIIEKPLIETHAKLIDLQLRNEWKVKTRFNDKYVERIGTAHECILPQGQVTGYAVSNEIKEGSVVYEEFTEKFNFLFPASSEVYYLNDMGDGNTELIYENHVHSGPVLTMIMSSLLKKKLNEVLTNFKGICESEKTE